MMSGDLSTSEQQCRARRDGGEGARCVGGGLDEMLGALSGLSERQLQGYLAEMRRIAALDDTAALPELDAFAWGLSEAIAHNVESGAESHDWLGQSREERSARFQQDLAAARNALTYPAGLRPFDGQRLRQS